MIKPLFIFSMPRSGSTLLQRVLASDKRISSASEPWLLLPLVYMLRKSGTSAEYSHKLAQIAIEEFLSQIPDGTQAYLSVMAEAMKMLYQMSSSDEAEYFLDKTPRYALILDEIVRMFPDGKFIILWRNPLAVVASIMETWGGGGWNVFRYKIDLYDGMDKLLDCYSKEPENFLPIKYEDLLMNASSELKKISSFLEMELSDELLKEFSSVKYSGSMGDPTGIKRYTDIADAPLVKWKKIINNPVRKLWCRRYLKWLGRERLSVMGYDMDVLMSELDSCDSQLRTIFSDLIMMIYGLLYCGSITPNRAMTKISAVFSLKSRHFD